MDLIAERGIAAHWTYKHGGEAPNSAQVRAHSWISSLLESQRGTGSSLEFLENVKVDLFPDEVYLFTPNGDILRSEEHTSELQSLMRNSYDDFCLKKNHTQKLIV